MESLRESQKSNFISENSSDELKTEDSYFPFNNRKELPEAVEEQTNAIQTNKYFILTAIPVILLLEISKFANLFYLSLALIQIVPLTSNSGGMPVILMPLSIVILINGIKTFYEDRMRVSADNKENKTKVTNLTLGQINSTWSKIRPGDLVKVEKDQYFPCDLILVYSSHKHGLASVETKSLDGETNLKSKVSVMKVFRYLQSDLTSKLSTFTGSISVPEPDANMHAFKGSLHFSGYTEPKHTFNRTSLDMSIDSSSDFIGADFSNFLLRGSSLKNTDFIIGIAAYTGHSTKIMKNSINSKEKDSHLTRKLDSILKKIVALLFTSCFLLAFLSYLMDLGMDESLQEDKNFALSLVLNFFRWFLNLYNVIPISIIVTIEMCRYAQSFFIMWDCDMYDRNNKQFARSQASSLIEELGQVRVKH